MFECPSSVPTSSCDDSDDAGVTCEGLAITLFNELIKYIFALAAPCIEGSVELRASYYGSISTTASGIVAICVDGVRNFICDTNWDFTSARIACESLGYSPIGQLELMLLLLL